MRMLIKAWFEYITIWKTIVARKKQTVFATKQCQKDNDFGILIYFDIVMFIKPGFVKLETEWRISKESLNFKNWEFVKPGEVIEKNTLYSTCNVRWAS